MLVLKIHKMSIATNARLNFDILGMVNGYEVIWLSPRKDLLRWVPQPQTCPVSSDRMVIHQSTRYYKNVLKNLK